MNAEVEALAIDAYDGTHTCGGGNDCRACDAFEELAARITYGDIAELASIDEDWAHWLRREFE